MRTQPPDLALTVLDALTAHIAVLDEHGAILAVNQAWRRFSDDNGGERSTHYVGRNYLAVCEQACAADAGAASLLTGLREVLAGTREHFEMEYPCHAPGRERWFIARVTRCRHDGALRVVVAHDDISARKQAELALAATERELLRARDRLEVINAELRQALEREQMLARTDELTGLQNRRQFFMLASQLYWVAQRYEHPLSLILFDVDHFKSVNDRFGHQVGDEVLVGVAALARAQLRASDVLARYGGEEFAIMLPNTDLAAAEAVAQQLRSGIAAAELATQRGPVRVTVSLGIAGIGDADDGLQGMIHRADAALYASKAAGRNRCTIDGAPQPAPLALR